MTDPDFLGLRDDDLTDDERQQLRDDPELAAKHREALDLGAMLAALPEPAAPRRRPVARAARWPAVVGVGLALAAAALLMVRTERPALTPRGQGVEALAVHLDAVETTQRRPLLPGDVLAPGEAVAFRVQTSAAGWVRIVEDDGTVVYPAGGRWQVEAGKHWIGGESGPLQWTTDAGAGQHRYRVELCVRDDECVTDELELVWSSER